MKRTLLLTALFFIVGLITGVPNLTQATLVLLITICLFKWTSTTIDRKRRRKNK